MKSRKILLVSLIVLLFTGCAQTTHVKTGKTILVSPEARLWDEVPAGTDLESLRGEDILSAKTARDILENNEMLND